MFTHKVYEDLLHVKKNYNQLEIEYEKEEYMEFLDVNLWMLQRSHSFYLSVDTAMLDTVTLEDTDPKILKLPFNRCNLELDFYNEGKLMRSCLFLEKIADKDRERFNISEDEISRMSGRIIFNAALRYQRKGEEAHFMTASLQCVLLEQGDKIVYSVSEPDFSKRWLAHQGSAYREENTRVGQMYCQAVIFFLRMLHAKNIETETIKNGSSSLNKKRIKRGKLPLRDYHVLKVRHSNGILSDVNITHNKTGKIRFHHVRGHFRTVMKGHGKNKKPEDVWVVPHVRGNKKRGEIRKDYTL